METLKNCTNCTRGPQELSQFEGKNGRPCRTCLKCREKGQRLDQKPERLEKHKKRQEEHGKEYRSTYHQRLKDGEVDEKKEHDLNQKCEWSKFEKNLNRVSKWKKLNVNERLGSYKRNAVHKNLEWTLSDNEAIDMFKSPCVYCNHLDLEVRLNGIDRLSQQGNYTKENTVPCCWMCNFMKGCLDPKTFINQCKKVGKCCYIFPDVPIQENIRPRKQ
jgi:hypothetical protein